MHRLLPAMVVMALAALLVGLFAPTGASANDLLKRAKRQDAPLLTLVRNDAMTRVGLGQLRVNDAEEYTAICCAPFWHPGMAARIDAEEWFAGCYQASERPEGSARHELLPTVKALGECSRPSNGRVSALQQLVAAWVAVHTEMRVDPRRDKGAEAREHAKLIADYEHAIELARDDVARLLARIRQLEGTEGDATMPALEGGGGTDGAEL